MSIHRIINGDSRTLSAIADKSVQLVVTSPPYWQLKDYGSKSQIGFNDSYEEYINNLNLVWQECNRVLADGCRMCVNIGDQFARSVYYGRYKVIPIRTEIIRFCEAMGMDYMGAVIWQKATSMNTTGGGAVMGSFPYPRNGILKIDYEFILIFKKRGNAPKPSDENKQASAMSKEEWSAFFSSHWNFSGMKQQEHLAMFPEELPRRLIKMFTFEGETVLDPFLGSGTTTLAAKNLNRNSVGYEINPDYIPVIQEKISNPLIDIDNDISFTVDNNADFNFTSLPYIFRDPHRIDKQKEIKKGEFKRAGSELFRVKQVVSPEVLQLSNNVYIRLIGVKTKADQEHDAVQFISSKTAKRRVFTTEDETKSDGDGMALRYLYLDNKTFINSHLIKGGYCLPDLSYDYRYRDKFKKEAGI